MANPSYKSKELIDEIENLVNNLDILISAKRITKIRKINASTMLGKGVIGEIFENIILKK